MKLRLSVLNTSTMDQGYTYVCIRCNVLQYSSVWLNVALGHILWNERRYTCGLPRMQDGSIREAWWRWLSVAFASRSGRRGVNYNAILKLAAGIFVSSRFSDIVLL